MYSEEEGGKRESRKVELLHITKNGHGGSTGERQRLLSLLFSLL